MTDAITPLLHVIIGNGFERGAIVPEAPECTCWVGSQVGRRPPIEHERHCHFRIGFWGADPRWERERIHVYRSTMPEAEWPCYCWYEEQGTWTVAPLGKLDTHQAKALVSYWALDLERCGELAKELVAQRKVTA